MCYTSEITLTTQIKKYFFTKHSLTSVYSITREPRSLGSCQRRSTSQTDRHVSKKFVEVYRCRTEPRFCQYRLNKGTPRKYDSKSEPSFEKRTLPLSVSESFQILYHISSSLHKLINMNKTVRLGLATKKLSRSFKLSLKYLLISCF